MGKMAHFRNLHEGNSSGIPAHLIYQSINPLFKLFLTNQIVLNNCKLAELELFSCIKGKLFPLSKMVVDLLSVLIHFKTSVMFVSKCDYKCSLTRIIRFRNKHQQAVKVNDEPQIFAIILKTIIP